MGTAGRHFYSMTYFLVFGCLFPIVFLFLELRQALGTQAFTYPVVLVDRWGATDDLATSSLHSSHLSVFLMAASSVMPVHSGVLSSHLFFCLPVLLLPCTVPCRIVLASPEDLVMCPYHFSLRRFTVVKRSSWGPMAKKLKPYQQATLQRLITLVPAPMGNHPAKL